MEGKTYYLGEDVVHQKRRRKRGVGLNAKQRKKLFELSKCEFKYETFKKINELWHSYIDSVINNFDSEKDQIKLIHADFHGAYFVVSASLNPVLVGCKGFVVQETKNTFRLINQENKLLSKLIEIKLNLLIITFCLSIPKHGTIFAFKHKEVVTKLNGSALRLNSFARTKIRMKMRNSFDVI